jgi:hypothetical protein
MAVNVAFPDHLSAWAAWLRHDGALRRLTVGLHFPLPAAYSSCSKLAAQGDSRERKGNLRHLFEDYTFGTERR